MGSCEAPGDDDHRDGDDVVVDADAYDIYGYYENVG